MPCLAVWYPDLPHYRLLPKSEPQCLQSKMHHRQQYSLQDSHTHMHSCGPGGWGGPNLRSSAGFVYFPPTSTPPPLFPSFLIVYLHNKLFLTPEHEEPFQSISLRARAEIYVKRHTLVNGRVNANDVWFLDLINAVYIATLRLLHGNGSQEKKRRRRRLHSHEWWALHSSTKLHYRGSSDLCCHYVNCSESVSHSIQSLIE